MRKIKLFIASSFDGYIARNNDDVDWLFTAMDYGYKKFYDSIDTIIIGRKTFDISIKLNNEINPYKDKKSFIFTRNPEYKINDNNNENVEIICNQNIIKFIKSLINYDGKNIWLVGGSEIISLLFNNKLVHDIIVSIHPIILGEGISLFKNIMVKDTKLKLIRSNVYDSGLIQTHYSL